ncbi:hypothetical protein OG901_28935 [Streptomyces mirabilis]|uniref:hypothetical protein n=1 Tax=Streptomyces mirabilis TaxID=68239 RepID=UPI00225553E0|nr:hypothetical protein [Streptomyces mirabilis]MCX5351740.1 hypothetical protein [Streptomyces mirabilis]
MPVVVALRAGHGWFPAAEKPVATLVDDVEASRKEWTKAAAVTDASPSPPPARRA